MEEVAVVALVVAVVGFLVAVGAVVLGVLDNVRGHKREKRILALEEAKYREMELAKKRAILRAFLDRDVVSEGRERTRRTRLQIVNDGLCEARNVTVLVDDEPLSKQKIIWPRPKTEIRTIGPKSRFHYVISPTLQLCGPWKITATWEDDSGEPGKYETMLTL